MMTIHTFDIFEQPKKQFRSEEYYRTKYGRYRGYYAWDLACEWFKTDNDTFFEIYGFSYVPKGQLFDEAKDYVFTFRNVAVR